MRILLVEDEYFIARELKKLIENAGGVVVGAYGDLSDEEISAAIENSDVVMLDINIKGRMAYELADVLRLRDMPFVFATGYDESAIPERFSSVPLLQKPFIESRLVATLAAVCGQPA